MADHLKLPVQYIKFKIPLKSGPRIKAKKYGFINAANRAHKKPKPNTKGKISKTKKFTTGATKENVPKL